MGVDTSYVFSNPFFRLVLVLYFLPNILTQATVTYPTEALPVQGGPILHKIVVESYVNMLLANTCILFVICSLEVAKIFHIL